MRVRDLELSDGRWAVVDTESEGEELHLLLRLHGHLLDTITLREARPEPPKREWITTPRPAIPPASRPIFRKLLPALLEGRTDRAGPPESTEPISVVLCTRDRTDLLAECLDHVLALDYPEFEVIVVDNAPRDEATAQLVADLPVRYVRENLPGLDRARNRGVKEARHDIVAFTDDDARPDRGWLRGLARGFSEDHVAAVTGPVVPARLDTPAQRTFEFGYGGMSHGFARRTFELAEGEHRKVLWASRCGVGANMAFRREALVELGGFDPALDVGTPSGGGGDVEMFHRLLTSGLALAYEPTALVRHLHRPHWADLRKLVFDNGRSFGAYLLTCMRRRSVPRRAVCTFAARDWIGRWLLGRIVRPRGIPRALVLVELWGALLSPVAYLLARHSARREG